MIKKLIFVLLFSSIAIIALIFSLINFHWVDINLYFTTISVPLVVALTIELFAGIAIGLLAAFFQIIKFKSKYVKLNKQLNKSK